MPAVTAPNALNRPHKGNQFNDDKSPPHQPTLNGTPQLIGSIQRTRRRRALQNKIDEARNRHQEWVTQKAQQIRAQRTDAAKWVEQERERRAKEAEEVKRQAEEELRALQKEREEEERRRAELAKQNREESGARREEVL
ncbi:trichohyalin, partial [Trypanosoma rangeli]